MAEDSYTGLIRRLFHDFETGDLDLLRVVMDDRVMWREPGRSPLAGVYEGPEAVLGLLRELKARTEGTFSIEILDVLSEPERVVVFQRETGSRAGRQLDEFAVVDFEVHHQKVTEVTVYHSDAYHFDEFFADDVAPVLVLPT